MALTRVLITGVHTGLGRALAQACLGAGATVYALSRQHPEGLEHERFKFKSLDLRRHGAVGPAVRSLLDGVENLDLAVLNAGTLGEIKNLADTSLDEIRAVMDVNVWANKILIESILSHGTASHIIGISSGASVNGSGGWGAYAMSKASLNLMLRVYADEYPKTLFHSLAPGLVDTAMLRSVLDMRANEHHPAISRIQESRGTSLLQTPEQAAERILSELPKIAAQPSGSYVDIRNL